MKLLPSRTQFKKWSVPSKWGFIGGVLAPIALLLSILGLALVLWPSPEPTKEKIAKADADRALDEIEANFQWLVSVKCALASGQTPPKGFIDFRYTEAFLRPNLWSSQVPYLEVDAIYQFSKQLHEDALEFSIFPSAPRTEPGSFSVDDLIAETAFLHWTLRIGFEHAVETAARKDLPEWSQLGCGKPENFLRWNNISDVHDMLSDMD
tara:strand:+ start:264 stop:887 length:624 start_codon:yes stop_codon:yes gene_type:complete